jgi:hypothetical protein
MRRSPIVYKPRTSHYSDLLPLGVPLPHRVPRTRVQSSSADQTEERHLIAILYLCLHAPPAYSAIHDDHARRGEVTIYQLREIDRTIRACCQYLSHWLHAVRRYLNPEPAGLLIPEIAG